jgi:hypothetical protein
MLRASGARHACGTAGTGGGIGGGGIGGGIERESAAHLKTVLPFLSNTVLASDARCMAHEEARGRDDW